jgi:hypothetical protein
LAFGLRNNIGRIPMGEKIARAIHTGLLPLSSAQIAKPPMLKAMPIKDKIKPVVAFPSMRYTFPVNQTTQPKAINRVLMLLTFTFL